MRFVNITFTCDGSAYNAAAQRVKCNARADLAVEVTLSQHGEMVIGDSELPDGWSNYLEDLRYDHITELSRRNTVACPSCKMKNI